MTRWKKIETLHCLIREERQLTLTCPCGHRAHFLSEKDIYGLIGKIMVLNYNRYVELDELSRSLRCGQCGGKRFKVEHSPRTVEAK